MADNFDDIAQSYANHVSKSGIRAVDESRLIHHARQNFGVGKEFDKNAPEVLKAARKIINTTPVSKTNLNVLPKNFGTQRSSKSFW
jgi:hypothetical protein